jgi:hypothetical protein
VTGRHAYGHLKPGADPPDATAITDAGTIGVESTALTAGDRRRAHGLFTALRRRVQEQEPAAFTKLRGHTVYVWFDTDEAPIGLPHRCSDEDAIRELVQALASSAKPRRRARAVTAADAGWLPRRDPDLRTIVQSNEGGGRAKDLLYNPTPATSGVDDVGTYEDWSAFAVKCFPWSWRRGGRFRGRLDASSSDRRRDLICDLLDASVARDSEAVRERRRAASNVGVIDAMPHRENDLRTTDLARCEPRKLALRPRLSEESLAQDHDPVSASGECGINTTAEAVANSQLELI